MSDPTITQVMRLVQSAQDQVRHEFLELTGRDLNPAGGLEQLNLILAYRLSQSELLCANRLFGQFMALESLARQLTIDRLETDRQGDHHGETQDQSNRSA